MLADATSYFPTALPPGYAYPAKEPTFDPQRHLTLANPAQSWTLTDLGYTEEQAARFPSPIAVTSAFQLMSAEGAACLQEVAKILHAQIQKNAPNTFVPASIRGAVYRSKFVRDFSLSPEVGEHISHCLQMPLVPSTYPHLLANWNFAVRANQKDVNGWHYDIVCADYVMMVHDPKTVEGGRTQYFHGTREEGLRLLKESGGIPHNRLVEPHMTDAGSAFYFQGCAVMHHGSPLAKDVNNAIGFRSAFVNSYTCRDVSKHDTNRIFFTVDDALSGGPKICRFTETARAKAWVSRAKLGTLLEELPFTEDRALIARRLRAAIADVNDAIGMLDKGPITREEAAELRFAADRDMFL